MRSEDNSGETVLGWRVLWIYYNLALFIQGMGYVVALQSISSFINNRFGERAICEAIPVAIDDAMFRLVIMSAVVFNLFFCLGPLAEYGLYRTFRWRLGRLRYVLFALGSLFAMLVISHTGSMLIHRITLDPWP